jgi:archaemetzincin
MSSQDKIIAIQPLGGVRGDVVEVVSANIAAFFQIPTQIFPDQPLPDVAHDPHRGQYNCYPILKFLGKQKPDNAVRIVGVADVDLFIPILTHVFGEAELGGHATVISTYRLDEDDKPVLPNCLYDRAAKIAVHEVAHTFRLQHCKEEGCIMNSFPVISHIDNNPLHFCHYCLTFLKDAYDALELLWRPGGWGGQKSTP